ncbi:YfiT family bacillithiol transferase [Bacillus suaedaesalsae]|uniref:Metal-dependent hydrolase n=1 Tax=Bacillus suaedaesalsae TaxID=2810349 RepID=A0ABS2DN49_9BACI|nr:putative metal-dependent hydrolase [Bacillus suaedaesalsae]MBM6619455.1 putative metal-dependent hydrolase [Bacillus suaedaesalsae]
MEVLRYPVGKFQPPTSFHEDRIEQWIQDITNLPVVLRKQLDKTTEQQLDTPYRDGGWTVRQVVHHLADSHMNCFVRFKLALTEYSPIVKTYDEVAWAQMPDSNGDLTPSLQIIDGIHTRWTILLQSMNREDYNKTISHPEIGDITLYQLLSLYSWHSRHHSAHIELGLNEHK